MKPLAVSLLPLMLLVMVFAFANVSIGSAQDCIPSLGRERVAGDYLILREQNGLTFKIESQEEKKYVSANQLADIWRFTGGTQDGSESYRVSEGNQQYVYGNFYTFIHSDLGFLEVTIMFSPPQILPRYCVGNYIDQSGDYYLTTQYPDVTEVGTWRRVIEVFARETVTTELGIFEAIKVKLSYTVGTVTGVSEFWWADEYSAAIRSIQYDAGSSEELVETSLIPVPEPSSHLAMATAVMSLCWMAMRRRRDLSG